MTIELPRNIVYVTRDIERALGMKPGVHGKGPDGGSYFVISNDTTYGREIKKLYPEFVMLVQGTNDRQPGDLLENLPNLLDTYDLLALPQTEDFIKKTSSDIVVFQNTSRIERLCREKKWRLLNPDATLAKKVEEKISQVAWLKEDAMLLPPHTITTLKNVSWSDTEKSGKSSFVLQFNHSHTGQGTYIITSEKDLRVLQEKFPDREVRVTDFISGPVFTVNAVVFPEDSISKNSGEKIYVGNPSYQITGLSPFTDLPFSTIGNDWSLPQSPTFAKAYKDTIAMAKTIGTRLARDGWRGLFGIDVIYDPKSSKTYLLEINARQPASTVFESTLESMDESKSQPAPTIPTIFEKHIALLLNLSLSNSFSDSFGDKKGIKISGSQIVKRVTEKKYTVDVQKLLSKNLTVMTYENSDHNKELLRIQSRQGIMKDHNSLNDLGLFIKSYIQ